MIINQRLAIQSSVDCYDAGCPRIFRYMRKERANLRPYDDEVESACKPGSVVDDHSSRPAVADGLERPTRVPRGPRVWTPIWSCFEWGLPCRSVARLAVRSYRTVSPLPDPLARPSAVCSLLHFPSARAAQALPGTLPCEARTFLPHASMAAIARPTPGRSLRAGRPELKPNLAAALATAPARAGFAPDRRARSSSRPASPPPARPPA